MSKDILILIGELQAECEQLQTENEELKTNLMLERATTKGLRQCTGRLEAENEKLKEKNITLQMEHFLPFLQGICFGRAQNQNQNNKRKNTIPKSQPSPPDVIYLQWWDKYGLAQDRDYISWCKDDVTCQGVKYKRVTEKHDV